MTVNTQNQTTYDLELGDVFPSSQMQGSERLFVSLSRLIKEKVGFHPSLTDSTLELQDTLQSKLREMCGQVSPRDHFVAKLVTEIESAIQPQHSIVQVSLTGFGSHELSALLGGEIEHSELNPTMGKRGVAKHASAEYKAAFELECEVIKQLRASHSNIEIVVPFVRTLSDAATIIDKLAEHGLPRGLNGLKVHFSVDVPSAALLSERLLHYFDGIVVNIKNLAQFTLGIDGASRELSNLFDIDNESVISLLDMSVESCKASNKKIVVLLDQLHQLPKTSDYLQQHQQVGVFVTS